MTPERWPQIEAIFHEALELDAERRSKFIKKAAGKDAELHAEVEKLLSQYDDASSFIEQPLLDSTKGGVLSALLDEADEDPMVGKLLGTYRIEREIGRGGMGAVYEAIRADGEFRLRAAIKVVKRGIDTDFVLKRFRNERQILAALDHPFITRLIDGGTTDDGRPYFVMDYIDGMPLYRYADKNRLTINERLQLFCRICEAVEYAHQKLVIHRDLKPSNLFVSSDGSPRLFDFGIAKLLDPEMASDTLQPTATALRMMTVDYASPEQVRGEKVTYATDVYSLGVILFELLTGYRPYKLKNCTSHEVARAICDDEPILPSVAADHGDENLAVVRVNPMAATLTSVADLRRESPSQMAGHLRGNLDGIIMKALAKRPDDRYASVGAFREDIERRLKGETVAIPFRFPRPEKRMDAVDANSTLEYRPSFAKRHYKSIAATAVILVGLIAAYATGVLTVSFSNNLGGNAVSDNATRSVAVLPFENATGDAANDYISDGMSQSLISRMATSSDIRTISRAAAFSYKSKQSDPQAVGRELGVDGVLTGILTKNNDQYTIKTTLLRVRDGKQLFSMSFVENSDHIFALQDIMASRVIETLNLQATGKTAVAQKSYTENNEAFQFYLKGEYDRQKSTPNYTQRSIEDYQNAIKSDPNYALAYQGMALAYRSAPDHGLLPPKEAYPKAEEAARKALAIDPTLSTAYVALASIKSTYDWDFAGAEAEYKKAITLGPNSSEAHLSYGNFLATMGRSDEAIVEFRNALQIDPNSPNVQTNIAWAMYIAGDYDQASTEIARVIERDPTFARAYLNFGEILQGQGKYNEAILAIRKAGELSHDPITDMALGHALASAGRKREAEQIATNLEHGVRSNNLSPFLPAVVYAGLDDKDKAFYWLERAYQERSNWLTLIKVGRRLNNLRGDPRFDDLLKRVGFDPTRS